MATVDQFEVVRRVGTLLGRSSAPTQDQRGVVQCGPYATFPEDTVLAYQKERDCIADYQRQGYERTPR